ncbi:hypothetical protein L195_g029297, partial [Trifolium pratense]
RNKVCFLLSCRRLLRIEDTVVGGVKEMVWWLFLIRLNFEGVKVCPKKIVFDEGVLAIDTGSGGAPIRRK